MPELIADHGTIVARKNHVCSWCNLVINKGESYEKLILKYDDIYTWKNHIHCRKLVGKLNMMSDCDDAGLDTEMFFECIVAEYERITKQENSIYIRNTCINISYIMHFVLLHHNLKNTNHA